MTSDDVWQALTKAASGVDEGLKAALATRRSKDAGSMYDMLGYSLGFLDERFRPEQGLSAAKRFRPALCLLIASGYGSRESATDAALAVELFHNFTLIHDDIEDGDEVRRNKPSLWKRAGISNAINAGDVMSVIACELSARTLPAVRDALFATFREVSEGQHMDFELVSNATTSKQMTREHYMCTVEKKSGALLGVAAEVGGLCTGQGAAECEQLRSYGRLLGTAFQIANDYRSVWNSAEETGKDPYGDIRERKRTLPFFSALDETTSKERLEELYGFPRKLTHTEVDEARGIINATSARETVLRVIRAKADEARVIAGTLSLQAKVREILENMGPALIPEIRE